MSTLTKEQIEKLIGRFMASFVLFSVSVLKIYDADSNILAFRANRYQKVLFQRVANGYRKFQIHKSRQLGNSTAIACYLFFLALFTPRFRVIVVANTHQNTKGLWEIYNRFVTHMPKWLKDYFGAESIDMRIRFAHGGYIQFYTAGSDAPRGQNYQAGHFSEVAFWADADRTFGAAMGTLSGSDPLIFLESTANGDNVWRKEWDDNPAYLKLFFSWVKDKTLDVLPKDRDMVDAMPTPQHILELQEAHGLLAGQVRWAKSKYYGHCRGNRLLFRQEFPTTPEEAFISSGDRVFEVYFKNVVWEEGPKVYQPPQELVPYILGVDTAGGGVNGDYSAMVVLDVQDPHRPRIAFTYYGVISPLAFARLVHKIATKYRALTVVERNNYGLSVIEQLIEFGGEHYTLYCDRAVGKLGKTLKPQQIGFWTGEKSRAQLISKLTEFIGRRRIDVIDNRLKQEINDLVWKGGKAQAKEGAHDDMLVALGLCLMGLGDVGQDFARDVLYAKKPRTLDEIRAFKAATGKDVAEAEGMFVEDPDAWYEQYDAEDTLSDSVLGL